jgi:putative transcriptional regulator
MSRVLEMLHCDRSESSSLIPQLRQLLGLTQEQFAAKLGVTLPTINRWENGRAQPSPLALHRIKAVLNDLSQSSTEAHRTGAQTLLSQYFLEY